jgi:hypothetical protein
VGEASPKELPTIVGQLMIGHYALARPLCMGMQKGIKVIVSMAEILGNDR